MNVSQAKKYELLNNWLNSNQGARVARAIYEEIAKISEHLSGKYLLQIGATGTNDLLLNFRFRNKIIVSPTINIRTPHTYAMIEKLPFADNSIDCIFAPFCMELSPNNKNLISELDRVLKSKGFIIFIGINPCSFWGIFAFFQKIKILSKFPLKLRTVLHLKKIFFELGYSQSYLNSFYYIPPVNNLKLIYNLEFLNEMGKMVWPYPGAFYCFVVQKCEYGLQIMCNQALDIDYVFKSN